MQNSAWPVEVPHSCLTPYQPSHFTGEETEARRGDMTSRVLPAGGWDRIQSVVTSEVL